MKMARKQKDTFFHDMATRGMTQALISMSKAGALPQVKLGSFPEFKVYACKDASLGDLTCDLACVLGNTVQEKQDLAGQLIVQLEKQWVNSPFSAFVQGGPGFIHFRIPAGASKRG